jgi:TonB family protein
MDRLLVCSILHRRTLLLVLAGGAAFALQDSKSNEKENKSAPTVYTPGGDVKPPKVIHYVEPQFSASSREAFVEGVVKLKTTVTPEGLPSDTQVTKGLNADEDRTAVEAVKQWRFQPGTKGGEAVHVRVGIEIAFHLM